MKSTYAMNLGTVTTPILLFDLYYKCTAAPANNFLAIVYTKKSKIISFLYTSTD